MRPRAKTQSETRLTPTRAGAARTPPKCPARIRVTRDRAQPSSPDWRSPRRRCPDRSTPGEIACSTTSSGAMRHQRPPARNLLTEKDVTIIAIRTVAALVAVLATLAAPMVLITAGYAHADPSAWTTGERRYLAAVASDPGPLDMEAEGEAQLVKEGHATCDRARRLRSEDGVGDPLPVLLDMVDHTSATSTPAMREQIEFAIRAAVANLCPEVES
jgi:hypothetical protein